MERTVTCRMDQEIRANQRGEQQPVCRVGGVSRFGLFCFARQQRLPYEGISDFWFIIF